MVHALLVFALAAVRLALREPYSAVKAAAKLEVLKHRISQGKVAAAKLSLIAESPVEEDVGKLEQDLDALTEKLGEQDANIVHDNHEDDAPAHEASEAPGEAPEPGSDSELVHHTAGENEPNSAPMDAARAVDEEGYKSDWHTEHKNGEYPAHPLADMNPKYNSGAGAVAALLALAL